MSTKQTSLFDFGLPAEPADTNSVVEKNTEDYHNEPLYKDEQQQPLQAMEQTENRIEDDAFSELVKENNGKIQVPDVIATENMSQIEDVVITERKQGRGRMKLSDMDTAADLIEVPDDATLFTKSYYPISTVSAMFKVNISLIRFWENEFDILKPKKNGKGDRLFRPEDVKSLQLIYHLLREKKYTIEGAKAFLKKNKKSEETFAVIESLKKMKLFLNELKASL